MYTSRMTIYVSSDQLTQAEFLELIWQRTRTRVGMILRKEGRWVVNLPTHAAQDVCRTLSGEGIAHGQL